MEIIRRYKGGYCSPHQKRRLVEFVSQHPEILDFKVSQDFRWSDSQKLWENISKELNTIPGGKKSWKQWKKTWQDIRSRTKKKNEAKNKYEVDDFCKDSRKTENRVIIECLRVGDESVDEQKYNSTFAESLSDTESSKEINSPTVKNNKHSHDCHFNCEMLAEQEKRKIQMKEDYLNFKKDYLMQKLEIMKQQAQALKSIAQQITKE